jgi:hypothetical protein
VHERGVPGAEARRESLHRHQSSDHHLRGEAQPRRAGGAQQRRPRHGRARGSASPDCRGAAGPRAALRQADAGRLPGHGAPGPGGHGAVAQGRRRLHPHEPLFQRLASLGRVPPAAHVEAEAGAGRLQLAAVAPQPQQPFSVVSAELGSCRHGQTLSSFSSPPISPSLPLPLLPRILVITLYSLPALGSDRFLEACEEPVALRDI